MMVKAKIQRPKCYLGFMGCGHKMGFEHNQVSLEEWLCACECHKQEFKLKEK